MKYVLLMGRGIEGTGNTKYAIEFQQWLIAHGIECEVFAENSKKWPRGKMQNNDIKSVSFVYDYEYIVSACNEADKVVVLSTPAKNYDEEVLDSFHAAIMTVSEKTVYIQVDHRINSINRNYYALEDYNDFFDFIDLVITHHRNSDFLKWVDKNDIYINRLAIPAERGINIVNPLDFDSYKKYWVDPSEKLAKSIKFIGRCAPWKGPWLLRDLHYKYLMNRGFITTLEGLERSIQSVPEFYKETQPERIPRDDIVLVDRFNPDDVKLEYNKPAYFFGPYVHDDCMRRMGKTKFGIELMLLNKQMMKSNVEYCMMEIVACGTIPVFRQEWGKTMLVNGKPIIEQLRTVIYMDENNPESAIQVMERLNADDKMYEEWRQNNYKFFKENFGIDTFGKWVDLINE